MKTPLQIETARINGAKSHGPVTPEGKAGSSQNAVRHAMPAQAIVLDAESAEQFTELLAALHEELQPEPGVETRLVEIMAVADWRRTRLNCLEREQYAIEAAKQRAAGCDGAGQDPLRCTALAFRALADGSRSLDLLNRYETRYDRQYLRTLARFEARRKRKAKK